MEPAFDPANIILSNWNYLHLLVLVWQSKVVCGRCWDYVVGVVQGVVACGGLYGGGGWWCWWLVMLVWLKIVVSLVAGGAGVVLNGGTGVVLKND